MNKSFIDPMPEYFDRYINRVGDVELKKAFEISLKDILDLDINMLLKIGARSYEENKWTINEIFQHLIDAERILSFRTLLIARQDLSKPPGFDQEQLARNSRANSRTLHSILDELILVRKATMAMFNSFDDEILLHKGYNWKYEMNVLAMGFIIVGHQNVHVETI